MEEKGQAVVEVRELLKRYGALTVVDGLTFTVKARECFGLLGPNGAGKTTTLRMILGVCPITEGVLKIFGLDINRQGRKIKAEIGVVPQEENLDPELTAEENLRVYARYFGITSGDARRRASELLDFIQLGDKRRERIQNLSAGMKRRLLIVRALVNNPRLLILDEPTIGLDPQARHLIWQKMRRLREVGTTMLLTTHYMEEATQLCDQLIIMDQGKIVASGSPGGLIDRYVPREVLEIRRTAELEESLLQELGERGMEYETTADTIYVFADSGDFALKRLSRVGRLKYLLRTSNLEDVFLKLTGRRLRE